MASSMSTLSRQAYRSLKASSSSITVRAASTQTEFRSYQPQPFSRPSASSSQPTRPPRPDNPTFFTGVPQYSTELMAIQTTLKSIEQKLREDKIWPIPKTVEIPPFMPPVSWLPVDKMRVVIGGRLNLRRRQYREITRFLAELNRISYIARLAGRSDLSSIADKALRKFTGRGVLPEMQGDTGHRIRGKIDAFGRAVGHGRRKTAIASVWITPVKEAIPYLEGEAEQSKAALSFGSVPQSSSVTAPDGTIVELPDVPGSTSAFDPSTLGEIPMGEILVNQLPLPITFDKHQDREAIIRPLRMTGLIGAFNIFALVRGGGHTGQAGAVALAISRALTALRPDTEPVLHAAGLLRRDPRMVERKKTNRLGARERRAWVKR